ncbi:MULTISPECIES: hypothetical protein [unclassified Bacillus (in: firmicutes)]|uniref:hypothetical protein n=1 Tax=unclassified Bacillus (in: firmicutes) TaxID=185979 RepID=UPI001BE520AC|nr:MULTISPECIES: hypothetical protein [unclassified Bacillus (in: firmicutes)]MBT2613917.1 hypothetical protein [Bacillus sp. ISL-78]MBT2627796.1 hypothetical protein [Bacillus sp. ISL-101]
MSSLNPFFEQMKKKDLKPKAIQKTSSGSSSHKVTSVRKVRKDKQHDIKFPVDYVMKVKLRTLCKTLNPIYKQKTGKPLTQTACNTLLLRFGLIKRKDVDYNIPYTDTKEYMHTYLLETEYGERGGLHEVAILKDMSDRRVAYCMIHHTIARLERGGSIEEIL